MSAEQQLHGLVGGEGDGRQVVAGHEPVALARHRGHGHAGLRERVEVAVDGAHGAAALRRQVGRADGGLFAQPHQDQQAAVQCRVAASLPEV